MDWAGKIVHSSGKDAHCTRKPWLLQPVHCTQHSSPDHWTAVRVGSGRLGDNKGFHSWQYFSSREANLPEDVRLAESELGDFNRT